jgi:hypothetical protein
MLFYCLLLFSFQKESSVVLDIPLPTSHPFIAIDTQGNIWCTSYWDHAVYKMNSRGKLIFRIGGKKGYGPGELSKPRSLVLLEEQNCIVVHGVGMKLSTFDMSSGKFKKILDFKNHLIRIFPWNHASFIGYTDPMNEAGGFSLVDSTGKKIDQWFTQNSLSSISNGYLPYAKGIGDIVYFQEGVKPEVNIIDRNKLGHSTWKLNLPLNYSPPPDKPMKREQMFNKGKVEEFYNSFSSIIGLTVTNENFLIVCWKVNESKRKTYQIYDIRSKKQITKEFYIDGLLVHSTRGFYTITLKQSEMDPDDEFYVLNRYKLDL